MYKIPNRSPSFYKDLKEPNGHITRIYCRFEMKVKISTHKTQENDFKTKDFDEHLLFRVPEIKKIQVL